MNVTKETTAPNKVKLTIELSSEEFEAGMAAAYKKIVKQINIPGFRKGKAPRKVIENFYGESVFYEEAFNYAFPKAYDKAIDEQDLFPVEQPQIDIVSIGTQEKTVFTAEFFVKPEVTLGQYKGIEVEKKEYPVTAEQIDAEIEQARSRNASWEDVDRACAMGDRATIDYAGTVDGVAFEGGTSENFPLELGSGTFIPGFEEQVAGMEKGQERDVKVTFPEDYRAEDLAGKEAVFHVKLNGVQAKNLPELDDEFAKDVSEFDTLADYRADVEKRLTQQAQTRSDNEFTNAVVEAVCANCEVEIPQPMIEREIDAMVRDMSMRFAYQGLSMDDFLKYTNQTMEQLRAQYQDQALSRVKGELVLEAVRKAENIEAAQEDIDALIEKYAQQSGTDAESFTKSFSDQDWDYIRMDAATQKTIEFLKGAVKAE
jgi:trigger factor